MPTLATLNGRPLSIHSSFIISSIWWWWTSICLFFKCENLDFLGVSCQHNYHTSGALYQTAENKLTPLGTTVEPRTKIAQNKRPPSYMDMAKFCFIRRWTHFRELSNHWQVRILDQWAQLPSGWIWQEFRYLISGPHLEHQIPQRPKHNPAVTDGCEVCG